MSTELEGEDFARHLLKARGELTIDGRRARERKPLSAGTKRAAGKSSLKSTQLNMRVTAEFKDFLEAAVAAAKLKQVDYVELAVREKVARDRRKRCVELS